MAGRASEQSIFLHAIGLRAPAERSAYLDEACGDQSALRADLDALLDAHDRLGDAPPAWSDAEFGPDPTAEASVEAASAVVGEHVGAVIGPYKILQVIGEGGMGTVFLAEQGRPVRRRVALKLIKAGHDSRQIIARFEAERQALALMDHPNIAKVLDAGATEAGRPYFVMELVHGVPITRYCDENRLTTRERLALFIPVCQAVQHAHQKGVIHRDLKPSNVLVAPYDGVPVPKVIDFGVAKAAGPRLTEATLFTEFGAVVGTPEYMSPEQAELNQLDVDTRSDIYSLGVLLYELLTGSTPLEHRRLERAVLLEVLRRIREEEAPRPSTRLSTTEGLASIAASRNVEPRRLSGLMRGELDWIVMKALEKDRRRRYETASGLAADLRRHLDDEPVLACPPSARYRFAKYARRHRAALTTAALVGLAMVAGTAASTWQAIRATRAVAVARGQRELASKKEREARGSAAESRAVLQFLVHDLLKASQPDRAQGRELKVADVLANAANKIATAFPDQPLAEANVHFLLASAFRSLAQPVVAMHHGSRALDLRSALLGAEDPDTLIAGDQVASILMDLGETEEARRRFEQILEIRRRRPGPEHPDTLTSMRNLAMVLSRLGRLEESRDLHRRTLEIRSRVLGTGHSRTLESMSNLAMVLGMLHQLDEAEALNRRALEGQIRCRYLGPDHPRTMDTMGQLASTLTKLGRFDEALVLNERAFEINRRVLGPEHPNSLHSAGGLAKTLGELGRHEEARGLFEQMLAIQQRTLIPEHAETLSTMIRLAAVLAASPDSADRDRALGLARRVAALDPGHRLRSNVSSITRLAGLLLMSPDATEDDHARALGLARLAAELEPGKADNWEWLCEAESCNGHWDAAIRAAETCIEVRGDGGSPPEYLVLALAHARRGDLSQAREWYAKARPSIVAGGPADVPRRLIDEAVSLLGDGPPRGDATPKSPPEPESLPE